MRSKEEAHDYRYFPDPDLLPLELSPSWSPICRRMCRNCPTRRGAFMRDYGMNEYNATVLLSTRRSFGFFK